MPTASSFLRATSFSLLLLLAGVHLPAQQVEVQPKGEPSNAKEAQEKKAAIDAEIEGKYQDWKATRPADEQDWIKVLEENLGAFYLPNFKSDKVKGKITPWDYVQDDPQLPRVLLIGDSISRGYTLSTRKNLAGKANVHRAPENCGPTANGLKKLDLWLGKGHWDVIHFNFGIHDRKSSDETYRANLQTFIDRLKPSGVTLVWATTTSVIDDSNPQKFTPERCAELNRIAKEVMEKNHIAIDDVGGAIQPRLAELQTPKDVHFSAAGYEVLGQVVAQSITAVLPAKQP